LQWGDNTTKYAIIFELACHELRLGPAYYAAQT